jgi:CheY-like chemotaxis protein
MVLAVVDDLMFQSKIRSAAEAAHGAVVFVRRRDLVIDAMRTHQPVRVILDLDRDALDPVGLIREIRLLPEFAATSLVGFASHVHGERLQEAREAGCDRVMARSGFVTALPGFFAPPGDAA